MPDIYTEPSVFVSKSEYTKLMEAKAKLDVLAKCVKKFEYASDFLKICEVVLGVDENDNF